MALSMFDKERAKKFRVFRNGDSTFLGKEVAVSRQHARNWDVFLEWLTGEVHSTEAVRDLCTPTGGTVISCYDDIEDRQSYVVLGRTKFKALGYLSFNDIRMNQLNAARLRKKEKLPPPTQRKYHAQPGVHSRLYEAAGSDVISIFVYANGIAHRPPRRVTLPRRILTNLNLVMAEVNQHVWLNTGAVRLLYTTNGKLIYEPDQQLENRGYYVAVGTEYTGFKQVDYGSIGKPAFTTYANNNKRAQGKRDDVIGARFANGRINGSDSTSTSANSSIPAEEWKNRRGVARSYDGESRAFRYANNVRPEYMRHSVESEHPRRQHAGPFHAKTQSLGHNNGVQTFKKVDYDKDEGGMFKSKRRNREPADQVQENDETRTDLPIDHFASEPIEDEEDEEFITGRRVANGRVAALFNNRANQQRQTKPQQSRQPPPPSRQPAPGRGDPVRQKKPPGSNHNEDDDVIKNTRRGFTQATNKHVQPGHGQGKTSRTLQTGFETLHLADNDYSGEYADDSSTSSEKRPIVGENLKKQQHKGEKPVTKKTDVVEMVVNNVQKRINLGREPRDEDQSSYRPPTGPTSYYKNGAITSREVKKSTPYNNEEQSLRPVKKPLHQNGDSTFSDRNHAGALSDNDDYHHDVASDGKKMRRRRSIDSPIGNHSNGNQVKKTGDSEPIVKRVGGEVKAKRNYSDEDGHHREYSPEGRRGLEREDDDHHEGVSDRQRIQHQLQDKRHETGRRGDHRSAENSSAGSAN